MTVSQQLAVEASFRQEGTRRAPREVTLLQSFSYAAPVVGSFFYYIPMWSILPGVYAKYFGLELTAIAAVVMTIRIFDGLIVPTVGYLSDRHHLAGGSRKPWVLIGNVGIVVACYFLFVPPQPATTAHYLLWSMIYFLAFAVAEIPHLSWGSELTMEYQRRAQVFGVRTIMTRVGTVAFYALPLLPIYASSEYTPQVLHDAVYVGAGITLLGLAWAMLAAPPGIATRTAQGDSLRLFLSSLLRNKPLMLYYIAHVCMGLCYGMWFSVLYFYLDSYLQLGEKVPLMFLVGFAIGALSTPLWVRLIRHTSKSVTWGAGAVIFCLQMIAMSFVTPDTSWWIACFLIIVANINFCCNDVSALSILGDITDYGKLKFHKDRGSTYFAFSGLTYQIGLGLGGGVAIGIAGMLGFSPAAAVHDADAVLGLKLGFIILPTCLACIGLFFIWSTPIDKRRHRIIQRRLESRVIRADVRTAN